LSASKFMIWRADHAEGQCVIGEPYPLEDGYELNRGIPREPTWPDEVTCEMNPEYPHDLELTDNLYGASVQIISLPLRDALIKHKVNDVEYLPVRILNHKGKVASKDYFILNPPSTVECIDTKASKVKWNVLNKNFIRSCQQLVIDDAHVPAKVSVFRAKHLPTEILVRAELARTLQQDGFSGLFFRDPADFRG